MNVLEKSSGGNGRNKSKNKGALALAFGLGFVIGGAVGALFALNIDKEWCCVGQSLTDCYCRYECLSGEKDRGDC
jgi:hypothetical protein